MRVHKNRATGLVALAAAMALTLTACGGDADDDGTTNGGDTTTGADNGDGNEGGAGGEITATVAYTTTNFHPSNTSSALALGANWHVVEGLYELNMDDFTPYKALAAEDDLVEISDTEAI